MSHSCGVTLNPECHHTTSASIYPNVPLGVFNRLFGKQWCRFSPSNASLPRDADNVIEKKCPIDKQDKSNNLQPLEGFPSQAERDDPNEERTACVDGRSGRSANGSRDRETKEVESSDADHDEDGRDGDGRVSDHLV